MNVLKNENITVLAGGSSCEREISLISGHAVLDALSSIGLSVNFIDPVGDFIGELKKRKTTIAFIALHGTFGEDGTVQKMLEEASMAYTGPGPLASEAAFHKSRSQKIFEEAGIAVPTFVVFTKNHFSPETLPKFSRPLVVKPSASGSSVGISIVRAENELLAACEEAFRYSDEILVEHYISGRELAVGILGDEPLPIVEVVAQRSFYDYDAKYKDTGTSYECPARLDPRTARLVSDISLAAYKALGCEIMSRADVILTGDGQAYLLEINTIPGLTGKSLLPKAAKAAGLDFPALCVKILELSLKKRLVPWSGR